MPSSSAYANFFRNVLTYGGEGALMSTSNALEKSSTSEWTLITADGSVAIPFDVFLSMDFATENGTVSAPIEMGSFATYNKKVSPSRLDLQLAIMGDPAVLQSSLDRLNELAAGTELVNIVSPEMEYKNYNLEKVSFSRSADEGVNIIYVDLSLIEVREVQAQYSSTRLARKRDRGNQQAQEESAASMLGGLVGGGS